MDGERRRDGDAMPAGEGVTAMTPAEFQATVKTLCDPLTRLAPRDVMHFTCLRLVKTVDALAASAEKADRERDRLIATLAVNGPIVEEAADALVQAGQDVNEHGIPDCIRALATALAAERTRRERAEREAKAARDLLDQLDMNWGPCDREDELHAAWLAAKGERADGGGDKVGGG